MEEEAPLPLAMLPDLLLDLRFELLPLALLDSVNLVMQVALSLHR